MLCGVDGVAGVNGGVASGLCEMTLHCIFERCSNIVLFFSVARGAVDVASMLVG